MSSTSPLTSISDDWWTNERFNSHLVEIATVFGESLTIPEVITNTDLETMAFLLEVCRHGEVKGGTVNNLTANLVKSDKPDEEPFAPLSGEFMVGLVNDEYPPQRLLGTDVSVGPCRIIIERAMLVDLDETKDKYRALEPGESLTVSFRTIGPVRQVFPRFYKGEQMFPLSEIQDSGTYK